MICSNCGAENPTGWKLCEQCATPFKKRCAHCGFENSAAARFCGECAAPLNAAAPELATQPRTMPSVRFLPKEAEAAARDGEPTRWPMPAKVPFEQATHFVESLIKGEPSREKIAYTVFGDKSAR
jgi:predicted amidophosphoribosyltransferase